MADKSDFIRTYRIKQQTPMIHFQHAETGVCLRASEVKPKLDKFILKWLNNQYELPEAWFMKCPEIQALNYKLGFQAEAQAEKVELKKNFFFNPEQVIYFESTLTVTCFCKETIDLSGVFPGEKRFKTVSLLTLIDLILEAFFMTHNFGKRQSKGYGSFSLCLDSNEIKQGINVQDFYRVYYQAEYTPKADRGVSIIKEIENLYALLRSGKKSEGYLFRYFSKKKIGNDKVFVRNFFSTKKDGDKKFIRSMLGLSGQYTYMRKTITVEHEQIKRFQTPLLFKPQNGILYIFPQEIPDKMYDAYFQFKYKQVVKGVEEEIIKDIITPSKKEFNVIDFLDEWMQDTGYTRNINLKNIQKVEGKTCL